MVLLGDEPAENEVNAEVNAAEKAEETEEKPAEEQTKEDTEKENVDEPKTEADENKQNEETKEMQTEKVAATNEPKPQDQPYDKKPAVTDNKEVERNKPTATSEGHLLMPNESKIKFVQDSFGFNNDKTTFEAPKFHPYLLMKNYSVQYMDPIIKKARPRRFLCCS